MRKSTIWLAALFLMCIMVLGWKSGPDQKEIQRVLSVWVENLGYRGVQVFLKWRSPGIALSEDAEENERLLEAEQQVYAMKAENASWKKEEEQKEQNSDEENSGEQSSSEQNSSEQSRNERSSGEQSSGEQNSNEQNRNGKNGNEQKDGVESKNTKERKRINGIEMENTNAGKTVSFPEYVQAAAADKRLCYSWSQLTDFDFLTKHFYQIHSNTVIYRSQLDGEKYLKKDLSINRQTKGPQILIYHTHGSEYFKDSDRNDPDTLITGVGEALKNILEEKYGYEVYHDTTVFPYNSSYSRGREKAKTILEKNPDIQVIIDMHRDSAPNTHLVTEIDGKQTAQIMFFNGMSQTKEGALNSRSNKNLADNLAFSLQLKLAAEQLYPHFTRKNYLKAYRYNMDLAGRYALIEVGAETNTLEEEINAMEPLAEILYRVLQ